MAGEQCVRLYQPDYEELKKVADESNISLAEVISRLLADYKRMMSTPQPQVIFEQQMNANPGGV